MSAIDQAFIRAYQTDDRPPSVASPALRQAPQSAPSPAPHAVEPPAIVLTSVPSSAAQIRVHASAAPSRAPAEVESASVGNQRRPLSTFVKPGPTVEARFKPALEVDQFRWSAVCDDLVRRHRDRLRPALQTLVAADEAGRSLIGIAAPAAGVGCTTVLACLARMLLDEGKSIAIVDANFAAPGLAAQLGLAVDVGWEEVLSGSVPLAECVVHSISDRLTLLPLTVGGVAAAQRLESIHASVTAGVLRYHYDMVLFDLGVVTEAVQGVIARRVVRQCRLDGVVLTSGLIAAAAAQPQRLMQSAPELATICLGVVENQLRAA